MKQKLDLFCSSLDKFYHSLIFDRVAKKSKTIREKRRFLFVPHRFFLSAKVSRTQSNTIFLFSASRKTEVFLVVRDSKIVEKKNLLSKPILFFLQNKKRKSKEMKFVSNRSIILIKSSPDESSMSKSECQDDSFLL